MRRVVASIVAAILLIVGGVMLYLYVQAADTRAVKSLDPVKVLVVTEAVPQGTPAKAMGKSVEVRQLPGASVAKEAVASVEMLGDKVAAVELRPGEQVLSSRFVDALSAPAPSAQVPKGSTAMSFALEAQRVHGGVMRAGDKVSVLVTVGNGKESRTKLVMSQVLVVKVQGGQLTTESKPSSASAKPSASAAPTEAPKGAVMVTLAVTTPQAETLTYALERGSVWLALDNPDTSAEGSRVVDEGNVLK